MNPFTHNGTYQGVFSGGPAHPQNLPKQRDVLTDPWDLDLLNALAQPTAYEKVIRRRRAIARYVFHSQRLAELRLGDTQDSTAADMRGELVERYQALYNFTEEEVDAHIAKTNRTA